MIQLQKLAVLVLLWIARAAAAATAGSGSTKEDFLVHGLEAVEPAFATFQGDMYAGLLPIDRGNGKLMFWLFESIDSKHRNDDSLVIWFNGGPGCSSFHAGLFFEMGPVTTPLEPAGSFGQTSHEPYGPNPWAWANVTNVMYVEQPVGVGFSDGADPPEDEEDVARDFYYFLQNFYKVFANYREKKLYMVGESYAGYYVPSMAHYIHQKNTDRKNKKPKINLKGIALGNGWADVNVQGPVVIDYAYWHGMIDSVTRDALYAEWAHCKSLTGSEPEPFHPMTTPDECGISGSVLKAAGAGLFDNQAPNTYDVTTWDKYLLLTKPDNSNAQLLNKPEVREALNVPKDIGKTWMGCIPGAGRRRRLKEDKLPGEILLANDKPLSMSSYLAELLDDAKIQVLIYNGDRDLSTCAQGSEKILDGMKWSGAQEWHDLLKYRRALWMVDGQVAGYAKSVKKLQFVIVLNSGHLVPYNQPKVALDLVTRLIEDKPYGDKDIPVVFDPKKAFGKSLSKFTRNKTPRQGAPAIGAVLFGFLAGVATFYAYLKYKKGKTTTYERLGDIETE